MESLKDYSFLQFLDTSSNDLIQDFFIPALSRSSSYDRGVGFFSSVWLRIASKGMLEFASNGGKARWVTSLIFDENDWKTLQSNDLVQQDKLLYILLMKNLDELNVALEQKTLSALSWMVADEILSFKLALPDNKLETDSFHDKFGVFTDKEGNQVSFNGSYNSLQDTRNYESIKVFYSWDTSLKNLVDADARRFINLWENRDPNVRVFDIPPAARDKILSLRSNSRPYNSKSFVFENISLAHPNTPTKVDLRDYQQEAISAWQNNKCRGILEMATGTGKTITSLAAAVDLLKSQNKMGLVIIVPYKHLVEQWADECEKFGFRPIKAVESSKDWEPALVMALQAFRLDINNSFSVVATESALQSGRLLSIIGNAWEEILIIFDEAHHAGSPKTLKSLPVDAKWRLGLSATPIRHYDEMGSDAILSYFDNIVFQYGLDKAIGKYLTPYYYYPIPVEMTDHEFAEYCRLTRQLGKYVNRSEGEMPEAAKRIAIKRAKVLNNSVSKLEWLRQNIEKYQKVSYALFYVGESLFSPVKAILGIEKRLRIHEFTQRQNNDERKYILEQFGKGELQALIAMKCLDEGVDVPPTREAYFLASSGNPREFIQRRGRVLRLYKGKEFAIIRDLISIPPRDFIEMGRSHPNYSSIRSSFLREYKRVKEFASLAINHYQSLDSMLDIANKLDLLDS